MDGKKKRQKISIISTIHYFRLVYRSVLFLLLLFEYILYRIGIREFPEPGIGKQTAVSLLIWIVFAVEMIFRFFPSKYEAKQSTLIHAETKYFLIGLTPQRRERPKDLTLSFNQQTFSEQQQQQQQQKNIIKS